MKLQKVEEARASNKVWNSKLVEEARQLIEEGHELNDTPFWNKEFQWRQAKIVFDYSAEERQEIKKCAIDVEYFADKYAYSMTDDGIRKITLRDYQRDSLNQLKNNRFSIWMASRQVGKCVDYNTLITIKNKLTGEISKVKIGDLFYQTVEKNREIPHFEQLKIHSFRNKEYSSVELLESIEYAEIAMDENNPDLKLFESWREKEYDVLTDTGWHPIHQIHQTQPYTSWTVVTSNGRVLNCADNHIILNEHFEQVFIKDLKIGDFVQTEDGPQAITAVGKNGYKVTMFDLSLFSTDYRYYTDGFLSHNTVTSGIFLSWYVCFHVERNILVMANKAATMIEIIDKIKEVLKHLPFFLKPGILLNNQSSMKFDNGCRLFGQATTKSAAIGFTIHLLFADEFAHIQASYIEPFWRSIYPTLSSSQVSRCIITSTPNGMNKFYDLYTHAKNIMGDVEGSNDFNAITTYWYQVPGRDDKWKQREIGNLGSEELFNQEYGLQFIAASRTLLGTKVLQMLKDIVVEYVWREIEIFDDEEIKYDTFKWHPTFDLEFEGLKYVLSVDLSDGKEQDFSIINIFELQVLPEHMIKDMKIYKDEGDFFRLKQIGLFRTNRSDPEEFAYVIEKLIMDVIGVEKCLLVLEMNFKGETITRKLEENRKFEEEIVLHTKHTEKAKYLSPGIRWNRLNKPLACQKLKGLMNITVNKILTDEKTTFEELSSFGTNLKGSYSSMIGHDDIAMTTVNITQVFEYIWGEFIEDIYDDVDEYFQRLIQEKLDNRSIDEDETDEKDFMDALRSYM